MKDIIELDGIAITPGLSPGVFIIVTKRVWDDEISPTIPKQFYPRYTVDSLVGSDSQIFKNFKKEHPLWWTFECYDKMKKILATHDRDIPKAKFKKLDLPKRRGEYSFSESGLSRIAGVKIAISRGLYEPYVLFEYYDWNEGFNRFSKGFSIAELNSELTESVLGFYNLDEVKYFVNFFEYIQELVNFYQVYLLGEEGVEAYIETIPDRELVDALNQGAYMTEEGTIFNPVTGETI